MTRAWSSFLFLPKSTIICLALKTTPVCQWGSFFPISSFIKGALAAQMNDFTRPWRWGKKSTIPHTITALQFQPWNENATGASSSRESHPNGTFSPTPISTSLHFRQSVLSINSWAQSPPPPLDHLQAYLALQSGWSDAGQMNGLVLSRVQLHNNGISIDNLHHLQEKDEEG